MKSQGMASANNWRKLLNPFGQMTRKQREALTGLVYIFPAFVLIGMFILYPAFHGLRLSFYRVHLVRPGRPFVGLAQYAAVLHDPLFPLTVKNTLVYTAVVVPTALCFGLIFALALNKDFPFKNIVRALVFIPWVLPEIVVASFWKYMLDGHSGIINELLVRMHIIDSYKAWFGSKETALITAALVMAWRTYPFMTILLLGGLQVIPRELYEAAKVDGASVVQSFRYITIPLLRYVLAIAGIIATLWALQSFGIIYVLTGGGPMDSSRIISLTIYDIGFSFFRLGRAAAFSGLLFVVVLTLAIIYVRQLKVME